MVVLKSFHGFARYSLGGFITDPPTHRPTDPPTHRPTDPPTHRPTHAPTHPPTHPPTADAGPFRVSSDEGLSYRRIFLVIQLTFFFSQLLEVVLVLRWNRALGIPDIFFLVGARGCTLVTKLQSSHAEVRPACSLRGFESTLWTD